MTDTPPRFGFRTLLAPYAGLTLGMTLLVFLFTLPGNGFGVRPRDAWVVFAYLLLYHAGLIALVIAAPAAAYNRAARRGRGALPWRLFGFGLGALIAVNAILAFPVTYGPLNSREQPFVTPPGLLGLVVFVAAPFILAAAGGGRRRLAVAWAASFAVSVGVLWSAARPAGDDLAAAVLPAGEPSREDGGEPSVVVLGFDGLSWNVILPLLERGELPAFAALAGRGVRGALATEVPTLSPALWTTIATGRRPADHGIWAFTKFRLPGMTAPLVRGPVLSTPNWWCGLNRVLQQAFAAGWVENEPFFSTDRRAPAIWDVADHHGLATGMLGWLAGWPVTTPASGGFRVSDLGPRPRSRTPADLRFLPPSPLPAAPPGGDPFVARTWRETDAAVAATVALVERYAPRVTAAYFRFPDPIQHHAWRGDGVVLGRGMPDLDQLPRELVASYRFFDRLLARLLDGMPPASVVLLVSDHGFDFDGRQHHDGPYGVLVMAGPGVRRGEVVDGATIYDVFPTVLALLGLPVTEEAPGRVLAEAFEPGRPPPRRTVASYEWYRPEARRSGERSLEVEAEELRRLRASGYVN